MKRYIVILSSALMLFACKSKQVITTTTTSETVAANVLINTHQALNTEFNTLSISANTSYKDKKNNQSFTTDIRIERDKQILISIKVIGFVMAKALITPSEVKYYEKINNTYFEGDFSQLSEWLGTPLDYQKVQNLLLGKTIQNLTEKNYTSSNVDGLFALSYEDAKSRELYTFESSNNLLKSQNIYQKKEMQQLKGTYHSHQNIAHLLMPLKFDLNASQENKDNNVDINIEYKSIKINDSLTFPYSVPSGYTQTQLD